MAIYNRNFPPTVNNCKKKRTLGRSQKQIGSNVSPSVSLDAHNISRFKNLGPLNWLIMKMKHTCMLRGARPTLDIEQKKSVRMPQCLRFVV
jgi:hypothetical protein